MLKMYPASDWRHVLCMVILLWTVGDVIRSWQFGHSAFNLWLLSWRVGLLIAMSNGKKGANLNETIR